MRLNSGHLQKMEALAATGMPGAYKVLIFFLVQQVHGLNMLGNIASSQSFAQILGFFTAIGWSSLILVRVAQAKTKKDCIEAFNRLAMMGGITLILCVIGTMLIGALLGKVENAFQASCWLAAWTLYQIPRHYFIALKAYRNALYLDAVVIGLSISSLIAVPAENVSFWLAMSMLTGGLATCCFIQNNSKSKPPSISYEIKGLEFGLTNFLSGGISLSLIPLASYFEDEVFAGILSLFVSVASIALLIPRSISLSQLPQLAQNINDPISLSINAARMRRQITVCNFFTSLVCFAIAGGILLHAQNSLDSSKLAPILLIVILQNALSTQSLVDANMLMAKEKSRSLLKVNFLASLIFFTIVAIAHLEVVSDSFLYICVTTAALNLYRLLTIKHYAKPIYDSNKAL